MSTFSLSRPLKFIFFSICTLVSLGVFSQSQLNIKVYDFDTKTPLPFCNVSVKGTTHGGITNSDGQIKLQIDHLEHKIEFSFLGYKTKTCYYSDIKNKSIIYLKPNKLNLTEVVVLADNDYLYDIISHCRAKTNSNKQVYNSKVYYGLETESKEKSIEFLECYYNSSMTGCTDIDLFFKNGRVALSGADSNFFLSHNTSKAILAYSITKNKGKFPSIPLQHSKSKAKRLFDLQLNYLDSSNFNIGFHPKNKKAACFSGNIWIDKKTSNIKKLTYHISNTEAHPFLPLFSSDSLGSVSMDVTTSYKQIDDKSVIDYISFEYSFPYYSYKESRQLSRNIKSKVLLYFYEYNNSFILPYFEYDNDFNDYRKLSLIPYNEAFWDNNNQIILSQEQKEKLGFIAKNGDLINFKNDFIDKLFGDITSNEKNIHHRKSFFENNYSFWDHDKRVVLAAKSDSAGYSIKDELNKSKDDFGFQPQFRDDLYELEVQILLDVTKIDSLYHSISYTIFDASKTFYHLPKNMYSNAFVNIYFDIYEIERRKMQARLDHKHLGKSQIDEIYTTTVETADLIAKDYLREVQLGEHEASLQKWNTYIMDHLGIDNILLINNSIE